MVLFLSLYVGCEKELNYDKDICDSFSGYGLRGSSGL